MITREEYELLKNYRDKGYKWIARDRDECVYVYKSKPIKLGLIWGDNERGCSEWSLNDDSLPCIKWEDEKPTKIDDLIRDYESHQKIVGESVNKTELIKKIEDILDDIGVNDYQLGECDEDTIWTISSITIRDILSAIEKYSPVSVGEKVKVTVPQFVADWIKEVKGTYTLKLLFTNSNMPSLVEDWLYCNNENCEKMALAWIFGYEIEKEKQYILKFSNGQYLYSCDLGMTDKSLGCKLTQAEIEAVDPRLMQFAVEVE